jgi:glycerophosphocholine phosphodiesterase GPCPD1
MIRYKQNKYPVLFLTQGVTAKYPEYNDPRTQNIPIAIQYALSANILGLSIHTEDILRDPSQVQQVLSHGLIAFCWGDDNNNKATIKYLKELGLNGIIYDRIDDHIEDEKTNIFLVEDNDELLSLASNILSPGNGISQNSFAEDGEDGEGDQDSVDTGNGSLGD